MRDVVVIVPARWASQRFTGKPLALIHGKPMIEHVVTRAASVARRVLVATDDDRIASAVRAFGGEVVMTRADHENGTSRIAEVAATLHEDVVVNVQGDEPGIDPALIPAVVKALRSAGRGVPMATIAAPFRQGEDPSDPNVVKVVLDRRGRALYFSRSVIPFDRDSSGQPPVSAGKLVPAPHSAAELGAGASFPHLRHVGLYAYRRHFLETFVNLESTPLERREKLEQLRALEHGYPIAVAMTDAVPHGIDTPEQLESFKSSSSSKSSKSFMAFEQARPRGST